jgi:Cu2+-exporting ATPase
MITGESRPVRKARADAVIAGTINGDGSLRIRVTATGEQTALAGIMRLVAEAQQSKSATQVLADRAAGWLFYIALAAAALTAVVWTIAGGFNWQVVVERVVTVLVIACPHALGLAVPLVVAISTSLAARQRHPRAQPPGAGSSADVDVVVFDKTGTLTDRGSRGWSALARLSGVDENARLGAGCRPKGLGAHDRRRQSAGGGAHA